MFLLIELRENKKVGNKKNNKNNNMVNLCQIQGNKTLQKNNHHSGYSP